MNETKWLPGMIRRQKNSYEEVKLLTLLQKIITTSKLQYQDSETTLNNHPHLIPYRLYVVPLKLRDELNSYQDYP